MKLIRCSLNKMISVKIGNLVELADSGEYTAIAHGCNCFKTMGAGIAAQLRNGWPQVSSADHNSLLSPQERLGKFTDCFFIAKSLNMVRIFNLYTQFQTASYDNPTPFDYDAFKSCLSDLNIELSIGFYSKPARLGIPLIGYGLAGGDLYKILDIVKSELVYVDVEIVIYDKEDGAQDLKQKIESYINN
jgi:hypothetical protein